ncbi:MAG TPA: hypothetical protein VN045_12150 [Microbacteriaceae bacterium]|nr:hypothetical protein [Microbacteriaceae bacterium]
MVKKQIVSPQRHEPRLSAVAATAPPQLWFAFSSVFHYLGPSFAVLLFPSIGVLGVAWLRIASAAIVFAPWTKPWRTFTRADARTRWLLVALGVCLALMNVSFYQALARLPMSLVATMEFVGTICVALAGMRTMRNVAAACLAIAGVAVMTNLQWASDPVGLFWSVLNSVFFVAYIVLGHAIAGSGASRGVERLGAAMAIAFVVIMPIGIGQAAAVFSAPILIAAGIAVGVCSSVIPYVCDQLAMSRLSRRSFALLLAMLPSTATLIGLIVLRQVPTWHDLVGLGLVTAGILLHRAVERPDTPPVSSPTPPPGSTRHSRFWRTR